MPCQIISDDIRCYYELSVTSNELIETKIHIFHRKKKKIWHFPTNFGKDLHFKTSCPNFGSGRNFLKSAYAVPFSEPDWGTPAGEESQSCELSDSRSSCPQITFIRWKCSY